MFRSTRASLIAVLALSLCGTAEKTTRAGAPQPFTEEAVARGISYVTSQPQGFGHGLAFVDLDGDTDPDVILLGRGDGVVGIYENDGTGHFIDHTATSGIPTLSDAAGVVAGDYDNDGDLDIYISQWSDADLLLSNNGGFQFTDVTLTAMGVGNPGGGQGCAWGDYDNDGWLDLYVANRPPSPDDPFAANMLYHNLGDGTFEEVAVALGVDRGNDPTFQPVFFDFDGDGDADLYLATDKGLPPCSAGDWRNHLFENVDGTFVDITDISNTEACIAAMCIAVGDFDGNGFLDLYSTNGSPGNVLLMNQGDGSFTRDEVAAGVASYTLGWGAVFFDYDNNGYTDLYVCNEVDSNRLYQNTGTWPCPDVSNAMGVDDSGRSMTVAVADIDDDGDLDLLVQNKSESVRLFVNHEGQQRRWAKFDIVGQAPSRYAVGAQIRVRVGSVWRLREVIAGSNFKNQNELIVHFGLDAALIIEEAQVMWPGGDTRTLTNLAINRTWRIYPPERLGDSDANGMINTDDVDDFVAVLLEVDTDADHVALSDMNGDSVVNGDDVRGFVQVLLP